MDIFGDLIAAINDLKVLMQHYGLIRIRKILSVIDAGLVPRVIEHVKQNDYPQLQLEATWVLTNVASSASVQCQSIIDKSFSSWSC